MEDKKTKTGKQTIPYLLLTPAFLFYAIFWLIPVLSGIKEVFTDFDGNFTLLGNFKLMFESEQIGQPMVFMTAKEFMTVLLVILIDT